MTGVFAVVDDDVWEFHATDGTKIIHLGTVSMAENERHMQIMFLDTAIETLTKLKKGLMQ